MEGSFSNVRQRDDAEENEADDHEDEATVDWVVQRIEGAGGLKLMATLQPRRVRFLLHPSLFPRNLKRSTGRSSRSIRG